VLRSYAVADVSMGKAIAGKEDAGLRRIFVRLQGAKAGA
jgi:hypothetical protein